ncbi:MAG: hypothetical protein WCT19_02495 [Candidatus Paceibacterota bacterium]
MRSSDTEQLENFKKCLKISNKIGRTKNGEVISYRVQYGNVIFYDWLLKIGLFPNKSRTMGDIKVPNKYFIDFLRGHLDGDGSVTTYTDYYNTKINPKYIYTRLFVKFISASKKHIIWLQNKISENLKISGRLHESVAKIPNHSNIFVIKFGKNDSVKLLKKIYYKNEIPSLSRKRLIAEKFIN